jgi:hypothetical protein
MDDIEKCWDLFPLPQSVTVQTSTTTPTVESAYEDIFRPKPQSRTMELTGYTVGWVTFSPYRELSDEDIRRIAAELKKQKKL